MWNSFAYNPGTGKLQKANKLISLWSFEEDDFSLSVGCFDESDKASSGKKVFINRRTFIFISIFTVFQTVVILGSILQVHQS